MGEKMPWRATGVAENITLVNAFPVKYSILCNGARPDNHTSFRLHSLWMHADCWWCKAFPRVRGYSSHVLSTRGKDGCSSHLYFRAKSCRGWAKLWERFLFDFAEPGTVGWFDGWLDILRIAGKSDPISFFQWSLNCCSFCRRFNHCLKAPRTTERMMKYVLWLNYNMEKRIISDFREQSADDSFELCGLINMINVCGMFHFFFERVDYGYFSLGLLIDRWWWIAN